MQHDRQGGGGGGEGAYPAELSAADRAGHVVAAAVLLNAAAAAGARLSVVSYPLRGILFVLFPHVCKGIVPLHRLHCQGHNRMLEIFANHGKLGTHMSHLVLSNLPQSVQ